MLDSASTQGGLLGKACGKVRDILLTGLVTSKECAAIPQHGQFAWDSLFEALELLLGDILARSVHSNEICSEKVKLIILIL